MVKVRKEENRKEGWSRRLARRTNVGGETEMERREKEGWERRIRKK